MASKAASSAFRLIQNAKKANLTVEYNVTLDQKKSVILARIHPEDKQVIDEMSGEEEPKPDYYWDKLSKGIVVASAGEYSAKAYGLAASSINKQKTEDRDDAMEVLKKEIGDMKGEIIDVKGKLSEVIQLLNKSPPPLPQSGKAGSANLPTFSVRSVAETES